MKRMTNLLSSMAPGDVFKKQLIKIYGTEFQKEITLNKLINSSFVYQDNEYRK